MTLAVLGLLAALAVASPPGNDLGLLPPGGFLGMWEKAGAARIFSGTELYEHIDGGAEVFYELGFERVTVQKYRAGDDEVGVELYALSDPLAALGIYLAKCGSETPAPDLADRHTAGRHQLLLVRDRFFLVVDNLSGKAERAPVLVEFARAIASRLHPPVRATDPLDLLPAPDRVAGSARLVRGPLGLQAFILLGEGDVLELGGRVTAVAARYDGGDQGAHGLVLAPYPNAAAAARAFRNVADHLDPELRLLAGDASRLVLRDHAGRFAVASLCRSRIEIRFDLGRPPEPSSGCPVPDR